MNLCLNRPCRISSPGYAMQRSQRFNKGSIRVSEGALRHFRSHPCRVFSQSYRSQAPFHGGNTGSNPVGDAKSNQALRASTGGAPARAVTLW